MVVTGARGVVTDARSSVIAWIARKTGSSSDSISTLALTDWILRAET